jgi:hypothetical protein
VFNEVPVFLLIGDRDPGGRQTFLRAPGFDADEQSCDPVFLCAAFAVDYLGHERLLKLAAQYGAQIEPKPVDLGAVFAETGGLPLAKRAPQRQAYRLQELARWSQYLGLPINPQPKFFPVDRPAARLMVAARDQGGADQALELTGAIMRALWAEDKEYRGRRPRWRAAGFFHNGQRVPLMTSYFCPCPRGMEAALAEELAEIAQHTSSTTLKVHNQVPGGVHCSGTMQDAYRINLHSRIASRVLMRMANKTTTTRTTSTTWCSSSPGKTGSASTTRSGSTSRP